MKSFKTIVVVVSVLIMANCVLIGMLWYNNYHRNQNKPGQRPPVQVKGQAFEYLTRELKLSPDQVKKYDAMRNAHMQFTRKTNEEQRMMRDSFFDNLKNPNANPAEVELLEKRILTAQNKLDTATFYHFRRFRSILDANQQARFDIIINNVLHMMAQPHPPGGRPGAEQGEMGPAGRPTGSQLNDKRGRHKPGPDGRPMYSPPDGPPDGRPGGPPPDGRPWPPPGSHPPPPGGGPSSQGPPSGGGPPPQGPPAQ